MRKNMTILIIDDKDQSTNIRALQMQLKQDFDLHIIFIRTTSPEWRETGSDHLDLVKLKAGLKSAIEGKSVTWALTDFDLAEKEIDGMNVVSILNDLRSSIRVLIYSGDRTAIVRKVLGKSQINKATNEEIVDVVRKMLEYNVVDCIKRDDYVSAFVTIARKEKIPNVQDFFVEQLRKYSDMSFKSCYSKFRGRKFGEIADMIEKKSNLQTDEWMQELIEQTIAYLVKINE